MERNEAISRIMQMDLTSSYESAMEALSSLISKRGDDSKRRVDFNRMPKYLEMLGLNEQISDLKIIHVAGTKGKGSTCTFSESILRESGFRTGLFTSPHLTDVRERFRINGIEISKDNFLYYFWDCWVQIKAEVTEDCPMPRLFHFLTLLALKIFSSEKLLSYLLIVGSISQHMEKPNVFVCRSEEFLRLGRRLQKALVWEEWPFTSVDVTIIEVGLGGILDSTNVIKEPVVCGITSLGMDHLGILGDTIEKIAFAKVGIFKPNVPAFTAPQPSEALLVLKKRASELMIPLAIVSPLDPIMLNGSKLGLAGEHQFTNAGLAVALCKSWLQRNGHEKLISNAKLDSGLPEAFIKGLSTARLGGRAQIIIDKQENLDQICSKNSPNLIFYLDGAHTPESMEVCARWFCSAVNDHQHPIENEDVEKLGGHYKDQSTPDEISKKIILFNCMQVRDPEDLLMHLITTCSSSGVHFSKALFAPSLTVYNKLEVVDGSSVGGSTATSTNLAWQFTIQKIWEKFHGKSDAASSGSDKLQTVETLSSKVSTCDSLEQSDPAVEDLSCSAVISSLPLAIKWLRDSATANPSLQLQVLVTGSLHLVGDVLKILRN